MKRRYQKKFAVKSRWNNSWSIANIKSESVVTNFLWMVIIPVRQPVEQRSLVGTIVRIIAKIAIPGLVVSLLRRYMEFVIPSVEDHTRPVVIAAKLHAMATCPVLYVRNPVKSAVIIPNAAGYVMSLAHLVLRIVPVLSTSRTMSVTMCTAL